MNIQLIAQILSREYSRMYGTEITVQIAAKPAGADDQRTDAAHKRNVSEFGHK